MRKRKPKIRMIEGDPRYNDTMVTKFVNHLMYEGRKVPPFKFFTMQWISLKRN